MAEATVEL